MNGLLRCFCYLGLGLGGGVWAAQVSPQLWVEAGAVNRVYVGSEDSGAWVYQADAPGSKRAQRLLLTHGRRDVLPSASAPFESWEVMAPVGEKPFLENPEVFWREFREKRFHDYAQQSTKIAAEAFPVDRWLAGDDELEFGGVKLRVLETPGYTRGSVSYVGEVDGKRTAFTGDLIYSGGRLIDLYSFQDAIPEAQIRGYHGYAARLADLVSSLERLKEEQLELIVPARGPLIRNPGEAMAQLIDRAQRLYANYLSTNALNWYFKEERMKLSGRRVLGEDAEIQLMPYSTHLETPDWILGQSTSRLIVADDGYAFLLDCGYQRVIDTIDAWIEDGLIRGIDGIFVTHFHDDHTDMVQAAAEHFECSVYAVEQYVDVLQHPDAYHLPALTSNAIRGIKAMKDGTQMAWRGMEFTFHFYPGQAYYHGGLLVRKPGSEPIFFIGDSFSPSGMDDYCLLNRNLIHRDTGYFLCLEKIRQLGEPHWLINEHIPHVFRFSDVELGYLEQRYAERHDILSELVPWDDPNYAIDEQWAVFYPYGFALAGGSKREVEVRITNHSPRERRFTVRPNAEGPLTVSTQPLTLDLASGAQGSVKVLVQAKRESGQGLVTADIASEGMAFDRWVEAMVVVE